MVAILLPLGALDLRDCEKIDTRMKQSVAFFAAVGIRSVLAWSPNSRHAKPTTPRQTDFRPMEWAAGGILAASLALSPLPSNAAEDTVPPTFPVSTIPALEIISENKMESALLTEQTNVAMTISNEIRSGSLDMVTGVKLDAPLASSTTLLANEEPASKPVEAKAQEPKKDAATPVAEKKQDPPKVEVAKAEPPKEAKKDVVASSPAPATKTSNGQKSSTLVADAKTTTPKKKDTAKSKSDSTALGIGVLAGATVALGIANSNGGERYNDGYYPESRYTNSADSNAPYSRETYASGSYSSGLPTNNRFRGGRRNRRANRYYSTSNRSYAPSERVIFSNSNAPYAQDTYESGSYTSGLPSRRSYNANTSFYRPDRERYRKKAQQWNETLKRRNRAGYYIKSKYGPDARKNGSVVNYLGDGGNDMNADGYNPKEPW